MSKLLIIDSFGLIFRAYHAYPMLTTGDGKPTNAIFGFLSMLISVLEKYQPDSLACSLESRTPTFRHELAHDYKANRKEMDEALGVQIPEIIEILNILNIKTLQKDGFEADDVIGSFAIQNQNAFDQIQIITGDRDLYQLISEKITILMPGFSFSQITEYDRQKFEDKYKISLDNFVLYKSLTGDSSDNIGGIPGVGPKTAEKIVNQFDSIDSILANLDQFPIRIATSIDEYKDLWRKYYKLCEIEKNIPLEIKPADLMVEKINFHKLRNIAEKYEFNSLKKRFANYIDKFEAKYGGFGFFSKEEEKSHEIKFTLVDKVDFPQSSRRAKAYIQKGNGNYKIGNGDDFVEVSDEKIFDFIIKNGIKDFVGFDIKEFIKSLLRSGIEKIENYNFFDLKLAWHLLRSNLDYENINELASELKLNSLIELEDFTRTKISEENIEDLFNLESELLKVLSHMEFTGINCDFKYLTNLEKEYTNKIKDIKQEIYDIVGFEFNPASTKELGHVLFEVLNLPVIRKTKTQYSTDDSTLSALEGAHDVISLIRKFRMYSKALSTYVVGLKKYIDTDGKIHTTFNQTKVATGRLSSLNPNLQNLPTIEIIGDDIKKAFKPSEGKIFLSFDYSQIDLRILAFVTQDPGLTEAFKNGEDIHMTTAKVVFNKDEVTKDERGFAKAINFGIVYGMEPFGLSKTLKIDQKTAKEFIDKYLERFKNVKKYFESITKQLDEKQFVNTFLNRRRFFPNWMHAVGSAKRALWREAINMPIQGGTSEVIKKAMIEIFNYFRKNNIDGAQLLQIHDEVIVEVDRNLDIEKIEKDIKNIMCSVFSLGEIPLNVSSKKGNDLTFS